MHLEHGVALECLEARRVARAEDGRDLAEGRRSDALHAADGFGVAQCVRQRGDDACSATERNRAEVLAALYRVLL